MTLAETLLPKVSEWRPEGDGRHNFALSAEGWSVGLCAEKVETLGALLWDVNLEHAEARPALSLQAWAEAIASRQTGLPEALVIHEIDQSSGVALLRSKTPTVRGNAVSYFEVRLHGTTRATLQRHQADKTGAEARKQVAFPLTLEALGNWVNAVTQG
jgi:hypothetical protein